MLSVADFLLYNYSQSDQIKFLSTLLDHDKETSVAMAHVLIYRGHGGFLEPPATSTSASSHPRALI